MIRRISIKNPAKSITGRWQNCKGLPQSGEITFTPGLNIVWGENGTGKSTLLREIARQMHCEQGNRQKVTGRSIYEAKDQNSREEDGKRERGIEIDHDGAPILFFDPNETVGVVGSAFDNDFLSEGVALSMLRASAGETTAARGTNAYNALFKARPLPPLSWAAGRSEKEYPSLYRFLRGTPTPDVAPIPTLLLDEGERSLSITSQEAFWMNLCLRAWDKSLPPLQVIIATHSPFALCLPQVSYIEMTPGYMEQSIKVFGHSFLLMEHMKRERRAEKEKKAQK